jgi:dipeptidyl aminopeptidase/acylaminoacyl peptidase
MHGSNDDVVPFDQSVLLQQALHAAGGRVDLYRFEGAGHGAPVFWTDSTLDIVHAFIRDAIATDKP